MDMRNDFSPQRVVKPLARLPGAVVKSSSLEEFQSLAAVVLRDMV